MPQRNYYLTSMEKDWLRREHLGEYMAPEAIEQRKAESLLNKLNSINLRKRLRDEENEKKAAERHFIREN